MLQLWIRGDSHVPLLYSVEAWTYIYIYIYTYRWSVVEAYECRGRLMLSLALFLSSKGSAGKADRITSLLLHNRPSFDPAHGTGPVRPGGMILVT